MKGKELDDFVATKVKETNDIIRMREYREKVTKNKNSAIKALQNAGILLEDASINPVYRELFNAG